MYMTSFFKVIFIDLLLFIQLEAIKKIVDEDLGFVVDETLTSLWKVKIL